MTFFFPKMKKNFSQSLKIKEAEESLEGQLCCCFTFPNQNNLIKTKPLSVCAYAN